MKVLKRACAALSIAMSLSVLGPIAALTFLAPPEMALAGVGQAVQQGTIPWTVGGDTGTTPVTSNTPANASHAGGQSVGGLFKIPVARTNGGSGAISRLFGHSNGGDVGQLQWKVWDKNPTNTTCTDNSAFVGSATDDLHLIASAVAMTPAVLGQTQGDTKTYFENDYVPPASYVNQDSPPTQFIYACAVAVATFTPSAQPYVVNATGYQN